jgi:hypothetical protein
MKYDVMSLMLEKHFSTISLWTLRPGNGLGCIHLVTMYLCIDENKLVGWIFPLDIYVGSGLSLYRFLIQTS